MLTRFNEDLILWNKIWNVQKGKAQNTRRAHHCLSLASTTLQERKDTDAMCVCEFYFSFLLLLSLLLQLRKLHERTKFKKHYTY